MASECDMNSLIRCVNLAKYFPLRKAFFEKERKFVHAVDGVSLEVCENETFGLVGESGCGKSTLGKLTINLLEPTSGTVMYRGEDLLEIEKSKMLKMRRELQIIFQDPYSSLNPRRTIRQTLSQPFKVHEAAGKDEIEERVLELLEHVELTPPHLFVDRYPHELSGGQKQRVNVARALALRPRFIVADEPVSALDVSIRAGILELLKRLQKEFGGAYLFITHDLSVVRSICARVAVMYLGKICEHAEVVDLFSNPLHPYTKAILSATPIPDPERAVSRKRTILKGSIPSPINPPKGCKFHTRCPTARSKCAHDEPQLTKVAKGRLVACWLQQ